MARPAFQCEDSHPDIPALCEHNAPGVRKCVITITDKETSIKGSSLIRCDKPEHQHRLIIHDMVLESITPVETKGGNALGLLTVTTNSAAKPIVWTKTQQVFKKDQKKSVPGFVVIRRVTNTPVSLFRAPDAWIDEDEIIKLSHSLTPPNGSSKLRDAYTAYLNNHSPLRHDGDLNVKLDGMFEDNSFLLALNCSIRPQDTLDFRHTVDGVALTITIRFLIIAAHVPEATS